MPKQHKFLKHLDKKDSNLIWLIEEQEGETMYLYFTPTTN